MQTKVDVYFSQKDLLKARYIENSSYFDALALNFGSQGLVLKISGYLTIAAGFGFGVFLFNPIMMGLFSVCMGVMGLLHHQYHTLNQRFDVICNDLDVSEKQLKQAVGLNRDLENQLTQAFRNNLGIQQQLEHCRIEIELVTQNAKLKEQEVERSKIRIDEVTSEVNNLNQELQQQKRVYSDKLTGFFALLENTAQVLEGEGAVSRPKR